ncbi:hypothetical protein GQX74_015673 [Glossina fuscipes]|nr:hypothetical protein GQX74_015673 [Glossina fuscipes]
MIRGREHAANVLSETLHHFVFKSDLFMQIAFCIALLITSMAFLGLILFADDSLVTYGIASPGSLQRIPSRFGDAVGLLKGFVEKSSNIISTIVFFLFLPRAPSGASILLFTSFIISSTSLQHSINSISVI